MSLLRLGAIAGAVFLAGFAAVFLIAKSTISFNGDNSATSGISAHLIGGPFTLTDSSGKRVTDADFRGKLMLVFFGYTHCPDVCPTALQDVAQAMDKLGNQANQVAPIFITVDPERDTPEVMASYVSSFQHRIAALTGTQEEIAAAAKAYRVYFRKADSDGADYSVDHSALLYLMDRQGKYLTHLPYNATPEAIAEVIKKHLSSSENA